MTATPLLDVRDLSVSYGRVQAVRAVSLSVPVGAIVSLIGANGAGKTSTLRAVSGMLKPAGGRIRFAGHELALPEGAPLHGLRGPLVLGVRPSGFTAEGHEEWPVMRVTPDHVEHLGDEVHASFGLDAPRAAAEAVQAAADTSGEDDGRLLADDERARFLAVFDGRVGVRRGEAVELRLDPERMHAFDAATGEALGRRTAARHGVTAGG